MTPSEIETNVRRLDTTSTRDADDAWAQLKPLGIAVVPYLAAAYAAFKKSQGRATLAFHSTRYARVSDHAFQLGLAALQDKATLVRYRACGLLAYSLRKDALPHLHAAARHTDPKTAADAAAAIDAISCQNHHLYIDRGHSGQMFWVVNDGDDRV